MKNPWFLRTRRFYRPVSVYGWLVTALAIAYPVYAVIRILGRSLKLNETLTDISLQLILTAILYVLIAYSTQKR